MRKFSKNIPNEFNKHNKKYKKIFEQDMKKMRNVSRKFCTTIYEITDFLQNFMLKRFIEEHYLINEFLNPHKRMCEEIC